MSDQRAVALCRAGAPICPKCGHHLGVHAGTGTFFVRCQRKDFRGDGACQQHAAIIAAPGRSCLVLALSPAEFRAVAQESGELHLPKAAAGTLRGPGA